MPVLVRRLLILFLPVALAGCEQVIEKSSNPLSPTVAGPMAGITIEVPAQVAPGPGVRIDDSDQPLAVVIGNPETNTERTVVLGVQVGFDSAFSAVAFARESVSLGGNGQTTVRLDRLPTGRTYYWRVKADDGANASGWSPARSFELLDPVVIGVPTPKSPVGGARLLGFAPILVVVNGQSSGPTGAIRYQYQVSDDQAFTSLVVDGLHVEDPSGESHFASPALIGFDKLYFWRVRILGDRYVGAWSRVESFRTPLTITTPGPSIPPPSAASLSECGPPTLFDPLAILLCHRSFYPQNWSHDDHVPFLKGATSSLNKAGVPGGPFGLLRKTSGNNCGGYSCDVICAGQSSSQKQWDILINDDVPTWGGAGRTVADGIRVDFCEVQ